MAPYETSGLNVLHLCFFDDLQFHVTRVLDFSKNVFYAIIHY